MDLVEEELTLDRGDRACQATLVRPTGRSGPVPGWVVLHGVTLSGREHRQLTRFTHALVSAGAAVMVPEVPEWRSLRLAPEVATASVRASIRALEEIGGVRPGVGVVGFSFGAPHAIACAAEPDLAERIAGVVGFGGYCDLDWTFRFMLTGDHGAGREAPEVEPDPYGRWVVGSNYLPAIDDLHGAGEVGRALGELAAYAGMLCGASPDGVYDARIRELRAALSAEHHALFDLFAPVGPARPDPAVATAVAERLVEAARRVDPLLDPVARLSAVKRPVHILHGRGDRVVSCAEADRMRAALPSMAPVRMTVTGLFGHSAGRVPHPLRLLREVPRFARALSAVLDVA